MLSEELFEKCEELFDLLATEHRTDAVEEIIEHVNEYLLDDVDGRTCRENYQVAEEVEDQLKALWELIPIEERSTNNNLRDYYDDILETTAAVLDGSFDGEESDDEDVGSWDDDFEDEEDSEC